MSVPCDYDQTNIRSGDGLMLTSRNGIAFNAQITVRNDGSIGFVLDEDVRILDKEAFDALTDGIEKHKAENVSLRELMYERAHHYALQHMTEDELRIVATNFLEQINKYRELVSVMSSEFAEMGRCHETPCGECPVLEECEREEALLQELGLVMDDE